MYRHGAEVDLVHRVPQHEVCEEDEAGQLLAVPVFLVTELEAATRVVVRDPHPHALVILWPRVADDGASAADRDESRNFASVSSITDHVNARIRRGNYF